MEKSYHINKNYGLSYKGKKFKPGSWCDGPILRAFDRILKYIVKSKKVGYFHDMFEREPRDIDAELIGAPIERILGSGKSNFLSIHRKKGKNYSGWVKLDLTPISSRSAYSTKIEWSLDNSESPSFTLMQMPSHNRNYKGEKEKKRFENLLYQNFEYVLEFSGR